MARATLAVRNTEPIQGEAVTLYGALPTHVERTILMQYLGSGTWHTVVRLRSQETQDQPTRSATPLRRAGPR